MSREVVVGTPTGLFFIRAGENGFGAPLARDAEITVVHVVAGG
jgi:hypothetical protein